jgi:hypothetical protein
MSAGQGSGALPDLVMSQLYTAVVSDILDDLGPWPRRQRSTSCAMR